MDILKNGKYCYCLLTYVIFLLFFTGCGSSDRQEISCYNLEECQEEVKWENSGYDKEGIRQDSSEEKKTIYMQVDGAVKNPGVYELPADARIIALIEAAGGFTKNASRRSVNQAAVVEDGCQVYVMTVEEEWNLKEQKPDDLMAETKININTATKEQLMSLQGIGEAKADSILAYRKEHGRFASIEELMNIAGIKQGVFNKMKDQITV